MLHFFRSNYKICWPQIKLLYSSTGKKRRRNYRATLLLPTSQGTVKMNGYLSNTVVLYHGSEARSASLLKVNPQRQQRQTRARGICHSISCRSSSETQARNKIHQLTIGCARVCTRLCVCVSTHRWTWKCLHVCASECARGSSDRNEQVRGTVTPSLSYKPPLLPFAQRFRCKEKV